MSTGNHAVGTAGLARGAAAAVALAALAGGAMGSMGCSLILGIEELNDGEPVDASVPPDAAPTELFVDPAIGVDENDCSRSRPCRTLIQALMRATAGQTIFLADGVYSVTAEMSHPPVPAGVTIAAMTPGAVTLLGDVNASAFSLQGDATIRGLLLRGFSAGIVASEGQVTLEGLQIEDTAIGLDLQGSVQVVAQGLTFTAGQSAFQMRTAADLRLIDSTISDMGPNCSGGVGIGYLQDSATVRFERVTAQSNYGSLELRQASSAYIVESTLINNGTDGCGRSTHIDMGESATLSLTDTTIEQGPGSGILALADNQVSIMGGSFVGLDQPEGLYVSASYLDVRGTKFSGYFTAMRLGKGQSIVRGVEVNGNVVGIDFNADEGGSLDLGNAEEPGGNTIQQNSDTGLRVFGSSGSVINAVGNTWNPGEQGADANGQMTPGMTLVGPVSGSNFQLSAQGPVIQF